MSSEQPRANSFGCNLNKWTTVMEKYVGGGFMYYTTLPTDALMMWRDVILETERFGFELCRERMLALGAGVRAVLEKNGFKSVAADGFKVKSFAVLFFIFGNKKCGCDMCHLSPSFSSSGARSGGVLLQHRGHGGQVQG